MMVLAGSSATSQFHLLQDLPANSRKIATHFEFILYDDPIVDAIFAQVRDAVVGRMPACEWPRQGDHEFFPARLHEDRND